MVTTVYDPVWMDGDGNGETIDGAMIEGFGNYRGQDMYLTLERCIRHITGRGKILIAQFGADTPKERYRRTAMYMLVKNDNSYIYINPGEVGWYPEYEIDLGKYFSIPKTLDELRIEGQGWQSLWRRDYENGLILCNTSENSFTINTPDVPVNNNDICKEWFIIQTSGGGEVSEDGQKLSQTLIKIPQQPSTQLHIEPSECLIIYSDFFADVELSSQYRNSISISPNPANEELLLKVNQDLIGKQYIITSIVGNEIFTGKITSEKNLIDVSKFSYGIYFLKIVYGNEVINKKFTICR
jgi:hypothetical protein